MQSNAEWRVAIDWLPVALVAGISQLGIGLVEPWTGSNVTFAVIGLLLALPLALRRSRPLLTCILVVAALVVQVSVGVGLHFGSFVAVLVSAYAAGQYARTGPQAALGAGILLLGGLGASFQEVLDSPAEVIFPAFYITAAAGLGRVVRRLTTQSAELRRLNEALAQEKETSIQLAVASERMRLARDLHDVVAHTLTVIVVQAEVGEEILERDPSATRQALQRIQQAGRGGLADLRSMVRVLRTELPQEEPDLNDVETLAAVLEDAGLAVQVERQGDFDTVSRDTGVHLFRIVQEALTNVVKHSASSSAHVRIAHVDGQVQVEITDPGPALTANRPSGGHGIVGMTERVQGFGGRVSAGPDGNGGFRVSVTAAADADHELVEAAE